MDIFKNKKQAKKASSKKNIQNKNGLDAAIYVGGASAQLAQVIYSHKDYDEYSQLDIFLTCAALFYIEIIKRVFESLPENEINSFVGSMQDQLIYKVHENWGVPEKHLSVIDAYFHEQIKKLSPYADRLVPDKKEGGFKGTLYWEFAKLVADEFAEGESSLVLTVPLSILPIAKELNEQIDTLLP